MRLLIGRRLQLCVHHRQRVKCSHSDRKLMAARCRRYYISKVIAFRAIAYYYLPIAVVVQGRID